MTLTPRGDRALATAALLLFGSAWLFCAWVESL